MTGDELLFFDKLPEALPVYDLLRQRIVDKFPDTVIKVSKTQISFKNKYIFAMASLPTKKIKGLPEKYLLVSFGLGEEKRSDRVFAAAAPYPGRWTHHVAVPDAGQVDDQLLDWISQAYFFAATK